MHPRLAKLETQNEVASSPAFVSARALRQPASEWGHHVARRGWTQQGAAVNETAPWARKEVLSPRGGLRWAGRQIARTVLVY
jgi:hypothetical protein